MMYRKISDFQNDWQYEAEATLKYLRVLTDDSLNQKVSEGGRDLGFLAWHLAVTIYEMLGQTGLPIQANLNENERPTSVAEILKVYEDGSAKVTEVVNSNWKDENLEDKLNMFGQVWSKAAVLKSLVNHQIHHRAQMSVLMRQAGFKIPGIYGPAKEEWSQFGMQAPK
ncbi:MAG: DinB family protein [bacterium]